MYITFLMFILMQTNNKSRYEESFKKSFEATYEKSEVKSDINNLGSRIGKEQPILATGVPIGYQMLNNRKLAFETKTFSPIDNTITGVDLKKDSALVKVTWYY